MSYWTVIVARNAGTHVHLTIESLIKQTCQPSKITIVNDGSTDDTETVLQRYQERDDRINVITLPDHGYDIRRVPQNINVAIRSNRNCTYDYLMISGDDCQYPPTYVEEILNHMDDKVVVASGRPIRFGLQSRERSPSGSGRVIRTSFLKEVGCGFPVRAGWEAWLLYQARMKGYETKLLSGLSYLHIRPRGTKHQFTYWGAAMYTLGYHPLYAFGRILRNLIRDLSVRSSLGLTRGYTLAILGSCDPFIAPFEASIRRFVYDEQSKHIMQVVSTRLI